MRVLAVNVGSSSVKLSVLDGDRPAAREDLPAPGGHLDPAPIEKIVADHSPIDAVGHRVVHGADQFTGPVRIDAQVRRRLDALVDLAPLHLPPSLAGIDLVSRLLPGTPAVACFDTAFHAKLPVAASTYALPAEWRRRWRLRRYGFHGLSHAWAARRVADLHGEPVGALRIVTCHLGAGASLAAVAYGSSVDTTMGFTPLEGLVMATRSGSVDPGLVLWLEEHVGIPPAALASSLEHRSGLLGLAGSPDMRAVTDAEARGDADAQLAVAVYLHRLRAEICAMAGAMGGLDALSFAGGVGEHGAGIRLRATAGLAFLGVAVDEQRNASARPDAEITKAGAPVRSFVIEAREDLEIAGEVRAVLGAEGETPPT
ncbi:MAG: acetate/propionate family kinase [Actinomycetota bacterium]|nr:acetate/propionate family kinase [Actinomycetota bacterium]